VKPVELRFDLLLRVTEPLLDGSYELVDGTFGLLEVVVRELTPDALCLTLEDIPRTLRLICSSRCSFSSDEHSDPSPVS